MSSIILHIPHSSTVIPPEIRDQFTVSGEVLDHEVKLMTDHYTDEIFVNDSRKDSAVIFPISRICVDPERFTDDAEEPMSKKGMGVLYTHSHDGSRIRRALTVKERQMLLDAYYYPHLKRLETMVGEGLKTGNNCLVIDCHSFPGKPLSCEFDQSMNRADICIGTDEFHTPEWLTEQCVRLFNGYGLKAVVNRPFSGSLVPGKYYRANKNVMSVMIEVNRNLYLEESSGLKNENFEKIKKMVSGVLELWFIRFG